MLVPPCLEVYTASGQILHFIITESVSEYQSLPFSLFRACTLHLVCFKDPPRPKLTIASSPRQRVLIDGFHSKSCDLPKLVLSHPSNIFSRLPNSQFFLGEESGNLPHQLLCTASIARTIDVSPSQSSGIAKARHVFTDQEVAQFQRR